MKQLLKIVIVLATFAQPLHPAFAAERELAILTAASMRGVMEELAEIYEQDHPGVEVSIQSGGSTALARKALDLELPADVIVMADESLFPDLLEPALCDYHLRFATERIVLAYHPGSAGTSEINTNNWADVLLKNDVQIGMANPDTVPVGYRTLMALRLADLGPGGGKIETEIMKKAGKRNQRSDVAELIAPLEVGAFDYAFVYGATAREANLHFIELPAAINLGDPARNNDYGRVSVTITGKKPGEKAAKKGSAVLYGAAPSLKARHPKDAEDFIKLLVSAKGRKLLESHGFMPVTDGVHLYSGKVPAGIRETTRQ